MRGRGEIVARVTDRLQSRYELRRLGRCDLRDYPRGRRGRDRHESLGGVSANEVPET